MTAVRMAPPLLFLAALLTLCLAAPPDLTATSFIFSHLSKEAKTLRRFHDPVVVRTSLLTGLPARHTSHYRLYSVHNGKSSPIPYQFDEKDEAGEIVFPSAENPGEFVFDDNDELVFMAKDTGERAPIELLPSGSDATLEIEVTDPVDGGRGWAYLLHFPDNPPAPSPVTYATFDPKTNRARALFYTIDYYPGRNFFTGMRISPRAGGTGENILNRMKVRVNPTFSLLFTTWSPLFTEEDFSVQVDGVKNGAVRAIRQVRQWLNLGKFFPEIPGGVVYTYYYFSSFATPSKFSVPWMVLKTLRSLQFTGVSEFQKNAIGMRYWDAANAQGLPLTGTGTATVKTDEDHEWYVISGKHGTHLQAFLIPEQWKQWGIIRGTVFQDDELAAGYSLLNMTNLRAPGTYDLNMVVVFFPSPYRPGDETLPLAMLKQPLSAQVRPAALAPCCPGTTPRR